MTAEHTARRERADRRAYVAQGGVITTDSLGVITWSINGQAHRTDGPAVEYPDGTKEWYREGQLHRVSGPAVIIPGVREEWWLNGQEHRLSGPAIEHHKDAGEWWINRWYLNGQMYQTERDWRWVKSAVKRIWAVKNYYLLS